MSATCFSYQAVGWREPDFIKLPVDDRHRRHLADQHLELIQLHSVAQVPPRSQDRTRGFRLHLVDNAKLLLLEPLH